MILSTPAASGAEAAAAAGADAAAALLAAGRLLVAGAPEEGRLSCATAGRLSASASTAPAARRGLVIGEFA